MKHAQQVIEIVESRIEKVERELKALRKTLHSIRIENNLYNTVSVATEYSYTEVDDTYDQEEKTKTS